jgi:hypothetical protein
MNPLELSVRQLKRAAAIKEQIEDLNKELAKILGGAAETNGAAPRKRSISASGRRKIAAAQRARWAKVQSTKPAASSAKADGQGKRKMSRATRAKVAAKLRAYWKAKKAAKS